MEFLKDVAQQVTLGVENARLFAALSQMASTDELTQLANRRRFSETLPGGSRGRGGSYTPSLCVGTWTI